MAEALKAGLLTASSFDTKWLWCGRVNSLLLKMSRRQEVLHAGVDLIEQVRHSGVDPNVRAKVVCSSFGTTGLMIPLSGIIRVSFNANINRNMRESGILK